MSDLVDGWMSFFNWAFPCNTKNLKAFKRAIMWFSMAVDIFCLKNPNVLHFFFQVGSILLVVAAAHGWVILTSLNKSHLGSWRYFAQTATILCPSSFYSKPVGHCRTNCTIYYICFIARLVDSYSLYRLLADVECQFKTGKRVFSRVGINA